MVLCKFFNVCAATKIVIGILVAAVVVIDHVHCKPFDETYIETTGGNDAVVTNETSIFTKTGTGNRVKLFVNKKFLLGNEDGTINATTLIDKFHDDIVWQRYSLKGEIVIRNSKHCYFVCINDCGYVYSTNLPTRDCLFVEELNESHYTYFYRKYKTSKMYLAVNLEGKTRRTVVDDVELLGKLTTPSAFTVIDHLTSAEDFATEKCAEIQSVQSRINVSPKKMCKIVKRRFKKENKIVGNEIPNDLTLKSLESGHHNMTNESAIEIVEWVNNKTVSEYHSDDEYGNSESLLRTHRDDAESNKTETMVSGKDNINLYDVDAEPEIEIKLLPTTTPTKIVIKSTTTTTTTETTTILDDNVKIESGGDTMVDKIVADLLKKSEESSLLLSSTPYSSSSSSSIMDVYPVVKMTQYTFAKCNYVKI